MSVVQSPFGQQGDGIVELGPGLGFDGKSERRVGDWDYQTGGDSSNVFGCYAGDDGNEIGL